MDQKEKKKKADMRVKRDNNNTLSQPKQKTDNKMRD